MLRLLAHPAFDARNPNRHRALVQTFSGNLARFHDPNGAGYRFLVDQVLAVDEFNPKAAARLVEPLGAWRRLATPHRARLQSELERLAASPGLSDNVLELAAKALA